MKYINILNNETEKYEFDDYMDCFWYVLESIGIKVELTNYGKTEDIQKKMYDNCLSVLLEWVEKEGLIEEVEESYTADELDCNDPFEIYTSFKLIGD